MIGFFSSMAKAEEYPQGYPKTDRTKVLLNADWKFIQGNPEATYFKTSTPLNEWENVIIPHTFELATIMLNDYQDDFFQKTFMRNVGWYKRQIFVPKSDKRVYLEFEGVHQITTLWVNGKKVGVHTTGGYTPFNFDITSFVRKGTKNDITILADNRVSEVAPPDPGPFDYIKFSGLYRDVYLVEKNAMHITSNLESAVSGVTITTPSVDCVNGNATIDIRTEIKNETSKAQQATLVQRVVDARGNVVLKMSETTKIAAGGNHRFVQTGGIEDNVKFWSIEHPYLYKVNTTLYDEAGRAIDVVDNRLGLRKIEYDHEEGFKLNGKNIEIVGMNRHQHHAYIGDAVPNSLHYKDMIQFKQLGFNCVRTAHYPQDDELIKACDELGILVYEEAPTWIGIPKQKEWFENERNANRAMIRNHKNSPSIFIWGAGINHRGVVAESQFVVKQEDPTRLTASQSSRWTGWQNSSWSDIYANMMYGPGIWGREEPLFAMEGRYGPEAMAPYFRDPMMPGMISWTAHAYYTFKHTETLKERTRSGAMDVYRYPKDDNLYWYPAEMKTKPYIHVRNDWKEGIKMLTVYSNATELELVLNGNSLGRFTPSQALKYNGLSHAPFEITDFTYEPGELKVIAYREGEVILEKSVFTPGKASQINLFADEYGMKFLADGSDCMIVHAEVLDKNGMRIRDFEGEITFTVDGDAAVVADPSRKGFNPVKVFRGAGHALIRAGLKPSTIKVTASCQGLTASSCEFKSVASATDMMLQSAYTIKDKETILLDLGEETQLTQFGWTPWLSNDDATSKITVKPAILGNYTAGETPSVSNASEIVEEGTEGAYTFTLKCKSASGVLRWLGEMNVIGKKGFAYGDGVLGTDKEGITLEIANLPQGKYALKSYHHAPSSNTNSMDPNKENLKKESIHKLPYASSISVYVNGKLEERDVKTSSGKEQQYADPTTSTVTFEIENTGDKVEILYKSNANASGVWLNAIEFVRYL